MAITVHLNDGRTITDPVIVGETHPSVAAVREFFPNDTQFVTGGNPLIVAPLSSICSAATIRTFQDHHNP